LVNAYRWSGGKNPQCSAGEGLEEVVDHPGRPEQPLENREGVLPEGVRLLEEPHPGPEAARRVEGASASGPRVAVAHRHTSPRRVRRAGCLTGIEGFSVVFLRRTSTCATAARAGVGVRHVLRRRRRLAVATYFAGRSPYAWQARGLVPRECGYGLQRSAHSTGSFLWCRSSPI